jgi:hypothetical protein
MINNNTLLRILLEADEEPKEDNKPKGFDEDPMGFILNKYEGLHTSLTELMGDDYKEYLTAVFIIAAKPTTFKIILHNGQYFFMSYMGNSTYECNIAGKRRYLNNIGTKELAMLEIVRLLKYGSPLNQKGPEGAEMSTRPEENEAATTGEEAGGGEVASEPKQNEPLAESITNKDNRLLEVLRALITEATDNDVLKVINSIPNVAILEPKEVKKIGKTGDNYAVYFSQLNHRDRKARIDAMNQIAAKKGNSFTKENGGWSSIGYATVKTPVGLINIAAKGIESDTASSTDVKEGLVQSFYYSDWSEPVTLQNLKSAIKAAIAGIKACSSISKIDKTELVNYLKGLDANKANVKILNQPLSQAVAIKKAYPEAELIRSGLFNEYRSYANQEFKMFADKWNPGDLYVLLNNNEAEQILEDADEQDNPASKAEILNNAFVENWGSTDSPLVSISLKFAKAQGGKAKSYFNKFKAAKTEYNLDAKEIKYKESEYLKAIDILRKNLINTIKNVDGIEYNVNSASPKTDIDTLRGKYAALKALNFFFSQFPKDEYDDALLALVAFGMSLSDLSPAFFKLVGTVTGAPAEIDEYPRGASLALYMEDGEIEPIQINDSASNGSIDIHMIIEKGGHPHKVTIMARNNGMVQGTIELTSPQKI